MTRDLRARDVPLDLGFWYLEPEMWADGTLMAFALSFDGYALLGDNAAVFNLLVDNLDKESRTAIYKCLSTTGLRAILFVEQRRFAHDGEERVPTRIAREVVETIRERLS